MQILHPERYSTTGVTAKKKGVVIHDSESGDSTAASLLRFLAAPGDRPLTPTRNYGSGYHAVTDGNGGYVMVADATCGPYAAPPLNKDWWHICMPGYAAQSREQWLDQLSLNHIIGTAKFIVDKMRIDGFPLNKVDAEGLKAFLGGYCCHWDVTRAFGQTTHTDVGSNFPWDVLWQQIAKYASPGPTYPPVGEEEMGYLVRPDNDAAVFIVNGNEMVWAISQAIIDARIADGSLKNENARVLNPATLKTYKLVGREPDYSGGDGGLPGRTTGASFAKWDKP